MAAKKDKPAERSLARVAYDGYAKSTGGKTYDNRPMPTWDELPERIRAAWGSAVSEVFLALACAPVVPERPRFEPFSPPDIT